MRTASRSAAGTSRAVSIPVELVTPTAIGSPSTQSNGTTIVLERSRFSVAGPSSVKGTIASSTVTEAIVSSSGCGLRTRMRISPGPNSTRWMSNTSGGGGFVPIRSTSDDPPETNAPTTSARSRIGARGHRRQPSPDRVRCARLHVSDRSPSTTSKKPIQPSSVNSDWCAWNMYVPASANSISTIPRWPWHCITVSVYSNWSVDPVG